MLERFFHQRTLPIGVDIGTSSVKLVQMRRVAGSLQVVAAARGDLGVEGEGGEASLERLTSELRRRLDAGRFSGRDCVLSMDSRGLRTRSFRMPLMTDEEMSRAVELEGAERLGFKPEEGEVGWIRAGEVRHGEDVREEIIAVGVERASAERVVEAVTAAGLRPIAIEPAFLACARAMGRFFRRQADQRETRLVVDIGSRCTEVTALRGDRVVFHKALGVGGAAFDEAAAKALGLDLETVADIRRQRQRASLGESSETVDPRVDRAVFDAVRPLLGDLAHEVNLCVRYSMVTFRSDRPKEALLVGGEAEEPRLAEVIAEATGVEARVGRPLEGVDLSRASFAGANRRGALTQWATATGLSLRGDRALAAERPTGERRARARRAA